MFSTPRRRRPWLGVGLVLGAAAIVAGVWAVTMLGGALGAPERIIAEELERAPSTPVIVPTELPPGYTLLGPGRKVTSENGTVSLATWLYGPSAAGSDLPLVELCISRRGEGLSGSCGDDRLEVLAAARGERLQAVAVRLGNGEDERTHDWEQVEFTRDWEQVAWVRDRRWFPTV